MTLKTTQFSIKETDASKRLDVFLVEQTKESRSYWKKRIDSGEVLINEEKPKKAGDVLKVNDIVKIIEKQAVIKEEKKVFVSNNIYKEIKILKETDDFLVIDKPSGLLVHPTEAKEPVTLAHWIKNNYPKVVGVGENEIRPGIVHRLDKETSGVLVIAKTQKMFDHLKKQFKTRKVKKHYIALVHGVIEAESGEIDFDIDRGKDGRMVARPKTDMLSVDKVYKRQPGKKAKTTFSVMDRFVNFSLLNVQIHTGRTHQIRVHMYAYNHPVVGDKLYFNKKTKRTLDKELGRIFLHALSLGFKDLENKKILVESKLPDLLEETLTTLT